MIVVSRCGHAGIVNTLAYARKVVRAANIYAVIGGFHLFDANDEKLEWTAKQLAPWESSTFWRRIAPASNPPYACGNC